MNYDQYLSKPFCIPYSKLPSSEKEALHYIIKSYAEKIAGNIYGLNNLNLDFVKLEELCVIVNYMENNNKIPPAIDELVKLASKREFDWKRVNMWALNYIKKKSKVTYYMKKKDKNYPLPKLTPKIID